MAMKKAIFFTIDSLLASGIVIIAILLVSNFYYAENKSANVKYASQDLIKIFSTTTVGDLDNDYAKSLVSSGDIKNTNNTVLEQIGEFWANNNQSLATNFTKNITEEVVPKNYGFGVLIDGKNIYTRNLTLNNELVSSRSMVSGISGASSLWGPNMIELRVWD